MKFEVWKDGHLIKEVFAGSFEEAFEIFLEDNNPKEADSFLVMSGYECHRFVVYGDKQ